MYTPSIEKLIEQFEQLPGIGRKSAERISFFILDRMSADMVKNMAETIAGAKMSIKFCSVCQNLTDSDICTVCASPKRDHSVICVVEGPKDVSAIEKTGEYHGLYHVLHGALSPSDGVTPEDIRIKELLSRLGEPVKEIIMATNPTVNGTATAVYIARMIQPMGIPVTRIAHGIPVGGDLEYADEITLVKAIEGRQNMF